MHIVDSTKKALQGFISPQGFLFMLLILFPLHGAECQHP